MRLKLLTFFILIFSLQTSLGVVAVKEEKTNGASENSQTLVVEKKKNTNLKKKKKFKLFQFLKMKKALKKKRNDGKEVDKISLIAALLVPGGILLLFLGSLGFYVGIAAGVLGFIGLKRIRKNDNLKGKWLVWIGIVGGILTILFLLLLLWVTASI